MIEYVFLASLVSIGFALYLRRSILKQDEGNEAMKRISAAIREGAEAFLRRQYRTVACFFIAVEAILITLVYFRYLTIFVPFAFLTGGFFSLLSGYLGMNIATRANARTAAGASRSLNRGLRIAFSSGAVMGFFVVGLGLLDITAWFVFLNYFAFSSLDIVARMQAITSAMLTFGMGASSVALFARVGGGIYTKAADVGADLVGKIEKGIPEDDERNPAVIADLVGDNVGDVAGMGADLYESYVGSIIATMALAVAAGLGLGGVTVPLALAALGIIASIIGTFLVRSGEEADQSVLLMALRKGVFGAAAIIAVLSYFIVVSILGRAHIGIYFAILTGLVGGILIGLSTEYFTTGKYRPTISIAESAQASPATVILSGISIGMMSTVFPVIIVSASIMLSFAFAGGLGSLQLGIYGIGVAAVGMLSTLGITLSMDAYGPVADNAGGIIEMTGQNSSTRKRTDALDALGNTTAATGKGFAIGSAALTALALVAAYVEQIHLLGKEISLSIMDPRMTAGLFIGAMLPFLFSSLAIRAVSRAAFKVVFEARDQFRRIKGIMKGGSKPKYGRIVDIVTKAAQLEMIPCALLAIIAPIAVGLIMGVEAVIGLLMGSLASGFVVAVFMANAGGSWDNAKKWIEDGHFGGKLSQAHKAAVIGDTIGDPFKDTAGPSLNILIKLMSIVSIVFASFIVAYALV